MKVSKFIECKSNGILVPGNSYYWTSSPFSYYGYYTSFIGAVNTTATAWPSNGYGVRCVSNDTILPPVAGTCLASSLVDATTTPTNLCTTGSGSSVFDNGVGFTYDWTCNGTNGGSNASCSANHVIPIKTVTDCTTSGQILYSTIDGTDVGLTCSDDIVICNGSGTGYTISACNAGATAVALSDNSNKTTSYGGLYQWGNNYDSRGGQFTDGNVYPTTVTQILTAQNYTTYTSNAFVQGTQDWTNQDFDGALRSAQWNVCSTGYHIPTQLEWSSIFASIGTTQTSYSITNQLKIPAAGTRIYSNASLYNQGSNQDSNGVYWSSLPNIIFNGYYMSFNSTSIYSNGGNYRANALSVRCFKN